MHGNMNAKLNFSLLFFFLPYFEAVAVRTYVDRLAGLKYGPLADVANTAIRSGLYEGQRNAGLVKRLVTFLFHRVSR
jgi:hypothetical protein